MPFETIHANHQVAIFPSPMEADLAILPAFINGRPSYPNDYIERLYGISDTFSARENFKSKYAISQGGDDRMILYVLTKDHKTSPRTLIVDNLFEALAKNADLVIGKKVWLPILGPETDEISIEEGFSLLTKVLNKFEKEFPTPSSFIISIPDSPQGRKFFEAFEADRQLTESSIDDLLTQSNCQIFLVSRQKQEGNMTAENVVQLTSQDIIASPAVSQIHQGDLFILHESFRTRGGAPILRIRSIGMAIGPVDDLLVKVDWKMQDVFEDLEGYGPYEEGILPVVKDVAGSILSAMDYEEQRKFYGEFGPALAEMARLRERRPATLRLAGIGNDGEKGEDYLDISKDVDAFARVIAATSFEPPLAIALFGKWGSGKSFFMQKLSDRIVKLSQRVADDTYCSGIAHIRFNAWSYMDANLWASLISQIFEALHLYIENDTTTDEYKKEIAKTLGQSLQMTKETLQSLEGKQKEVQDRLNALESERKSTQYAFKKNLRKLERRTLMAALDEVDTQFDASGKILAACQQNKTFVTEEAELERIVPKEYWQDPTNAYHKIRSAATFIRECCRGGSIWGNIAFIAIFLALFASVPIALYWLSSHISRFDFRMLEPTLTALVPIGVLFGRAQLTYRRMRPVISAFWKVKVDYEHQREQAKEAFEQKEKALKLAIEKDSHLLLSLSTELEKARSANAELQYRIDNILSTEALHSFIQSRSADQEYRKHLGIISIIRKDLEILNGLFVGHRAEWGRSDKSVLHAKMTKPLERIVLYVDDLDRCPEDTVVQVLEAVNLLMAFPLFVVIVGVDPRWIKNALLKRHALQFAGNGGRLSFALENDHNLPEGEAIDPARYLEKIFQIAFHLKEASGETIRQMVRKVAIGVKPPVPSQRAEPPLPERPELPLPENSVISAPAEDASKVKSEGLDQVQPSGAGATAAVTEKIEPLQLSEVEIGLLEDLGEIVGSNPRALKRFVNIYRIVRVHEDFAGSSEMPKDAVLAVLFLLALSIGKFSQIYELFNGFVEHSDNRERTIRDFLQRSNQQDYHSNTAFLHQLGTALNNRENYILLQQTPMALFAIYNKFIRRFTFH
jgi:hypothetical protein